MPDSHPPALDKLLSDLRSPQAAVKKRAILEILRSQAHQALFALKEVALQDDDVEIRYFASKALNFLKAGQPPPAAHASAPPAAGDLTLESAANVLRTGDVEARIRCLQQIVQGKNPRFLSLILEVSIEEADPMVRSVLPLAIGILGDRTHVDFIIHRFLKDPNARVRANAIEALERMGSEEAHPYIIGFLQDKDNRVRANAALALNKLGKVNLIRTLDAMLRDPKVWMRDSATYALSVIKIPEVVPLLARAMDDPYEGIRIKAKRGLQGLAAKAIPGARDVLERFPDVKDEESLEDFLRLGEAELSAEPVAAAPVAAPPVAAPPAPAAAAAPPPPSAEPAAPASEPAGQPEAGSGEASPAASPEPAPPPTEPMEDYPFEAPDRDERMHAVVRAVSNRDVAAGPLILKLLEKETDVRVRATMAVALGRLGCVDATETLIGLMEETDSRVRANAIEGLGHLKHDRAYQAIIRSMKDGNQRVVANALWALKDYPHIDIYPHLEAMSMHRKEEFRRSAIWLISRLKTYSAVRLLERRIQDTSEDIRKRSTTLLKQLRDEGNSVAKSICQKARIR